MNTMIHTSYLDECNILIKNTFLDFDAVRLYADTLKMAPIDIEYFDFYTDDGVVGTFNISTFEIV